MVVIIIYILCLHQSRKYQVKAMDVYIEPLIDKLLKLWNDIIMYDVSEPMGRRQFQFRAMLVWTIHDALGLTHFYIL